MITRVGHNGRRMRRVRGDSDDDSFVPSSDGESDDDDNELRKLEATPLAIPDVCT